MMDEVQVLRKNLKKWEAKFFTTNGRKPGKEDIENAGTEIKDLYVNYSKARKSLPSKCVTEVAWGRELNKKHDTSTAGSGKAKAEKPVINSVMNKMGQKLLANATLSMTSKSHSKVDRSFRPVLQMKSPVENVKPSEKDDASPHNDQHDESNADNSMIRKDTLDVFEKTMNMSFKPNCCSHTAQTVCDGARLSPAILKKSCKFSVSNKFMTQYSQSTDREKSSTNNDQSQEPLEAFANEDVVEAPDVERRKSPKVVKTSKIQTESSEQFNVRTDNHKQGLSSQKYTEDVFNFEGTDSISQDSNVVSKDSKDNLSERKMSPKVLPEESVRPVERRGSNRGTIRKRKRKDEEEDDSEIAVNEGVVGWDGSAQIRPERAGVGGACSPSGPGAEAEGEDADKPTSADDEGPVTKKRKTTAKASGKTKNVNENFVRLNMKLKTYRRKGKGMTGSQHKRMAWKNKMKSRNDSRFGGGGGGGGGGGNKCFKCGQEGHWANKCKGAASKPREVIGGEDSVVPVDEADFPSLQDAANMAQGIKTTIKANKTTGKKSTKKASAPKNTTSTGGSQALEEEEEEEEDEDEDELLDIAVVRTRPDLPPPPPPIEPLYSLNPDGSIPENIPPEVQKGLKTFGFDSFRPGQQQAVMRILCGQSTLVILSTGAGKSLCYQLPAYLYSLRSPCITLVVSPLVSLMEDQVTGLPPGINGCCLHTNMTKPQREKVVAAICEGEVHFLLVSPEALSGGGPQGLLPQSSKMPPIAFACIDEAHCVSEWSHHFRPSYLRICKILKENYGVQCLLGLTATATTMTAASVAQHLGIRDYGRATIRNTPVPPNLLLSASRDEDKDQSLLGLLQGDRFSVCRSIIIYCTRRPETERIATFIRTVLKNAKPSSALTAGEPPTGKGGKPKSKGKGKAAKPRPEWDAECYHAGLTASKRRRVQNLFMSGQLRVVVATVAFGMGLDKSDVRGIIHYNMPKSFESYVQEIGRAGRDGKASHCHVFLDYEGKDRNELKRHIYANTVDRYVVKRMVRRIFTRCLCRQLHEKHTQAVKECEMDDDGIDYAALDMTEAGDDGSSVNAEAKNLNTLSSKTTGIPPRICAGHERAIPIEEFVNSLDMPEESISTLLCYLELHPAAWVENLSCVYATCSLQCYGGPHQLQNIAKKCPPVAVAIASARRNGKAIAASSSIEFNVVEVSDSMGWNSGPVKRELKMLPWDVDPSGSSGPRKSGVMVEFSDLAFHLRSYGDLTDEETDEVVEFLHERITTQERTSIAQLYNVHGTLKSVSHKDVWMCADHLDEQRSDRLKAHLTEYFEQQPDLDQDKVTPLSFTREIQSSQYQEDTKVEDWQLDQVQTDIRQFIHMYGDEHTLSGRSIARIFHGISSPVFPASTWGRVRRFWRCHLQIDFNTLIKTATPIIIKLR